MLTVNKKELVRGRTGRHRFEWLTIIFHCVNLFIKLLVFVLKKMTVGTVTEYINKIKFQIIIDCRREKSPNFKKFLNEFS